MAIEAKRFEMLGRDTNLPVADFTKSMGKDVLNSVENSLSEISDAVKNMIDATKESDVFKALGEMKDEGVRWARDALSSLKDLTNFTENGILNMLGGFLPDTNIFKKMFNMLSSKCRNAAAAGQFPGLDDLAARCGNGDGRNGCTSEQFNNILNGLSGGLFGDIVMGIGKLIGSIVALAKIGFELGMCGILSALAGITGADKNVLGMASGALFGTLASNSNTAGIFSLANDTMTLGIKAAKVVPGAIGLAVNNFNPKNIAGSIGNTFERFAGSMEILGSENWNKTQDGLGFSVSNYSGENKNYANAAADYSLTGAVSDTSIPSGNSVYAAALKAKANSSINYSLV